MLGLAFIATGAALSSWFDAFRVVGVVLILTGLVILLLAVWPPLQSTMATTLASSTGRRQLALWVVGVAVVLGLAAGGGWIATRDPEQSSPLDASGVLGDASLDVACDPTEAQCLLMATELAPGTPLVWFLPQTMTEGSPDGVLAAKARIEGEVAGRYVALACRVDEAGGEYVLAVRPENQSFRLIRWDGGVRTELAGERLPAVIRASNQVNELRLECRDAAISAVVNGTPVASADEAVSTEGDWYLAAGIFAENTQPAPLTAHFDQIVMLPDGDASR